MVLIQSSLLQTASGSLSREVLEVLRSGSFLEPLSNITGRYYTQYLVNIP
jgi:hypothetical protein